MFLLLATLTLNNFSSLDRFHISQLFQPHHCHRMVKPRHQRRQDLPHVAPTGNPLKDFASTFAGPREEILRVGGLCKTCLSVLNPSPVSSEDAHINTWEQQLSKDLD
jgi:hypothetical protein